MTTVRDVAVKTVAAASESYYRFDPTLHRMQSFCQQFVGNFLTTAGVSYTGSYGSADAARADSNIYTDDWRQASPGDIIYLSPNHVGVYEGNGVMVSATGWGTNAIEALGKSVYRHRVDDYAAHLALVGFSHTNGNRPRVTGLTAPGTAGGGSSVFEIGVTMFGFEYAGWKFLVVPGLYIKNTPSNQAEAALALAGLTVGKVNDLGTLHSILWDAGFDDQFAGKGQPADGWALLQTLAGGRTLYTTAWKNAQAGSSITDAQLATLAAKLKASLTIPTAAENGKAARDAIVKA